MKLAFSRHGLQFFFVTVTLKDRPAILSRLLDEHSRPALSPFGEAVRRCFAQVHDRLPSVTVSDYAIMPDHIHFLMIMRFDAPGASFSPLWATHRILDAVEAEWQSLPPPAPCFVRSPYLELSFDARQLKAIRRYIRLNPARALWKIRHPNRFVRFSGIRHAVLDPSRQWAGMGMLAFLGSPFLRHVRLTMRKTATEHAPEIERILDGARRGEIPVCGFISPGEVELLRRLKAEPSARFVKMSPRPLPANYDPSAEDSRELAAGRMLILSPFPEGTPDTPETLRRRCLEMNDLAAAMCERSAALAG